MVQAKVIQGSGGSLIVVVLSPVEMRVIRHAIRASNALRLSGRVAEPGSSSEESFARMVVFMVADPSRLSSTPVEDPSSDTRWPRRRRERGLLAFLNGPLLELRPPFPDVSPESPVSRARQLLQENSSLTDSDKIAA